MNKSAGIQSKAARGVLMVMAALMGFCSMGIPALLRTDQVTENTIFELLARSPDHVSTASLILLFVVGLVIGMIDPKRPFVYGMSTMAIFPMIAIYEKVVDMTTHQHFPIEFLYYVLISTAAIAGAFLGKEIGKVR